VAHEHANGCFIARSLGADAHWICHVISPKSLR